MLFQKAEFPFSLPKTPRNPKSAQFLLFAATPLVFATVVGVAMSIVEGLALMMIFGASIYALTLGIRAEEAYNAARVARKPKLPLKIIGAGLMGLAVSATVYTRHSMTSEAVLVGFVAIGLFVTAFGLDPLKHKGAVGPQAEDTLKAHDAVAHAEEVLSDMSARITEIGDTQVSLGFVSFERSAQRLFRTLRDDPERHRDVRRHLGVYLDAAHEATQRFAILHAGLADEVAKSRFIAMLSGLATQFEKRTDKYLTDGKSKLDVEIDVLQSRLASESRRV